LASRSAHLVDSQPPVSDRLAAEVVGLGVYFQYDPYEKEKGDGMDIGTQKPGRVVTPVEEPVPARETRPATPAPQRAPKQVPAEPSRPRRDPRRVPQKS
jgi:hypothetical protein